MLAPHTLMPAPGVNPGDFIDDERHGIVVVDEIRRGVDGYTLLGWPPDRRGHGRRVSIVVASDDRVRLVADDRVATVLAEAFRRMIGEANDHLQEAHDAAQPTDGAAVAGFSPPYGLVTGPTGWWFSIALRGIVWSVPVAPPVPPAPYLAESPAQHPAEEDPAMPDETVCTCDHVLDEHSSTGECQIEDCACGAFETADPEAD